MQIPELSTYYIIICDVFVRQLALPYRTQQVFSELSTYYTIIMWRVWYANWRTISLWKQEDWQQYDVTYLTASGH